MIIEPNWILMAWKVVGARGWEGRTCVLWRGVLGSVLQWVLVRWGGVSSGDKVGLELKHCQVNGTFHLKYPVGLILLVFFKFMTPNI